MRKALTAIVTASTVLLAPAFLSSVVLADEEVTPLLKQSLEGMEGIQVMSSSSKSSPALKQNATYIPAISLS